MCKTPVARTVASRRKEGEEGGSVLLCFGLHIKLRVRSFKTHPAPYDVTFSVQIKWKTKKVES